MNLDYVDNKHDKVILLVIWAWLAALNSMQNFDLWGDSINNSLIIESLKFSLIVCGMFYKVTRRGTLYNIITFLPQVVGYERETKPGPYKSIAPDKWILSC